MDGWHHQLNGHEFEQTLGDGEGQTLGKADLEDIFSGVVSTELGPSLETQRHRGQHVLLKPGLENFEHCFASM